jgi:hypothetical protein
MLAVDVIATAKMMLWLHVLYYSTTVLVLPMRRVIFCQHAMRLTRLFLLHTVRRPSENVSVRVRGFGIRSTHLVRAEFMVHSVPLDQNKSKTQPGTKIIEREDSTHLLFCRALLIQAAVVLAGKIHLAAVSIQSQQ